MTYMVSIPLSTLLGLAKKAEQRDVILRYAVKSKYSIDKVELFNLCGEELPQKEEEA